MANGTTRNALSQIALRKGKGNEELNEELAVEKRGHGKKIDLKYPSPHNHSTDTLNGNKNGNKK